MPRETTQHHTDLEISNIDEGPCRKTSDRLVIHAVHLGDVIFMPRETTQHHTDLEISNIDEGSGEPDCVGSAEPDVPGGPCASAEPDASDGTGASAEPCTLDEPCASNRAAASDEPAKFLIAGLRPLDFVKRIVIILIGSAIFTFGVHNIHNVTGITEGVGYLHVRRPQHP